MNQTYKMTLSNGQTCERRSSSAGEAVQWALQKNRGLTVTRCYTGMTSEEADAHNKRLKAEDRNKSRAYTGTIEHDIPPHRAIEPDKEPEKTAAPEAEQPLV